MVVFNDILGRLPLYYYNENGIFSVSREVKFIKSLIHDLNIDIHSLTEYLLYGFPLGGKTLLKNVRRLMPATVLEFNTINKEARLNVLYPVNYEDTIEVAASTKKKISDLKDLFVEVLCTRSKKMSDRQSVIALSGGLDSRAVLAGLSYFEKYPKAYTSVHGSHSERIVANQLAEIFNVDLDIIEVSDNFSIPEYERFVKMIDGLNVASHLPQVKIAEKMLELYGDKISLYTGLCGGELFRYLNPTFGIKSNEDLVRVLLSTPDKFRAPVEAICNIMNISLSDLKSWIYHQISQYPECNVYKKYLHFKFEKDYWLVGAGEDRIRIFSWNTTPFYTYGIYKYAISIDENVKSTLFFRDFLYALDPRICGVKDFSTGVDLNNTFNLRMLNIPEQMVRHPKIRKLAASIIDYRNKGHKNSPDLTNLLAGYIDKHNGLLSDYFKIQGLIDSMDDIDMNDDFLHRILTLSIYIYQNAIRLPIKTGGRLRE